MKKFGQALAVLVALVTLVVIGNRFGDGPIVQMLPGGPLTSGEWVEQEPADWGFVADHDTVELETDGRSRITWILTIDGKAYIPASLVFPPFKTWHETALEEPAAVVRIDGKRYARRLQKIDDPALEARLAEQVKQKYGGPPVEGGGAWFFRLDPPA